MGAQASSALKFGRGRPLPYGCTPSEKGAAVNFSLCAPGASSVWVVLELPTDHPAAQGNGAPSADGVVAYDADSTQDDDHSHPLVRRKTGSSFIDAGLLGGGESAKKKQALHILLDATENRSGSVWHLEIKMAGSQSAGLRYAWLLDPELEANGRPVPSAHRVLDPFALALDSPGAAEWNLRDGPKYSPTAVVPDSRAVEAFDWEGVSAPGYALQDLIIYEAHVRGFTKHADSGISDHSRNAGTFLGLIEKIPHLLRLGINCIELLPVFEFDETACPRTNPRTGEMLCNYWGYSTVSFFVPMQRFARSSEAGGPIVEFKQMVRELHRHKIEVILDVVFNHTAEGTWGENNWYSLEAVAKSHYYLLQKEKHTNFTGCGNTVNANNPLCAEWICESLRFWALEMRVDGFRFDLASTLCRGEDGSIQSDPFLVRRLCNDPCLSHLKLLAEPWDCSWPDGYLVGRFPSCGPPRFAEWNGKYRDTVRNYLKGDPGMKGEFATRLCGSEDLYKASGRGPCHSINFVTAHDGFTLKDLVSFSEKRNACNGENSGEDHNQSWNCGAEGPTADTTILALRERQHRNFLVALFVSLGTPMLSFGDEYGRTQDGCNNGWCQDTLSWFSWQACAAEEGKLFRFTRLLISLRKQHCGILSRTSFLTNKDIWFRVENWDDPYNYLCYVLHDHHAGQRYSALLIAFNAGPEVRECELPRDKKWFRIIDTSLSAPDDFCEDDSAEEVKRPSYTLASWSCIVLKTFQDHADAFRYEELEPEFDLSNLTTIMARTVSQEYVTNDDQLFGVRELANMQMNRTGSFSLLSFPEGAPG